MITKKLKKLVIEEAILLKQHARIDELEALNFNKLYPNRRKSCIYGQMTGDCHSNRAIDLLNLCTKPYISETFMPENRKFTYNIFRAFSPIEHYIDENDAKNDILISFLKGEIGELIL